ncbi:MAG: hypothetical protein ABI183_23230 [Polyangiaceae bacterium]
MPVLRFIREVDITTNLAGDLPHEVGIFNGKQPTYLPPIVCP